MEPLLLAEIRFLLGKGSAAILIQSERKPGHGNSGTQGWGYLNLKHIQAYIINCTNKHEHYEQEKIHYDKSLSIIYLISLRNQISVSI